MTEPTQTLFDRIGGAAAVREMLDDFYARVMLDHDLRHFFENSSAERLVEMQKDFFAIALDGPATNNKIDLAAVHHGRGITRRHLTRFVHHLIDVLSERSAISSKDAMAIIFRIATYSDQIIGESGGADG